MDVYWVYHSGSLLKRQSLDDRQRVQDNYNKYTNSVLSVNTHTPVRECV